MPVVTVMPGGLEIDVEAGEVLAQAAWAHGCLGPTRCWGEAECMVCAREVISGDDAAEPPGEEELAAIDERMPHFKRRPGTRLACRLRVLGEGLVVEKVGVIKP